MDDPGNWQTPAALAIIAITIIAFVIRAVRRHKRPKNQGSCGEGCGCSTAGKPVFLAGTTQPRNPEPEQLPDTADKE